MRSLPGLTGRRRISPATAGCQPVPHVIARYCFRSAAHTCFQTTMCMLDFASTKLHAWGTAMIDSETSLARRTVLTALGVGGLGPAAAAAMPAQAASAVATEGGEIWSSEYWTKKGDIPLWMFRKRIGAPKPGEPARPVVFFVHGSSVTSRVFDLNVPGKGEYSVMNEFARYGFDVWTMDHENYGKSGRTSGNADIASGAEDLKVAVELIARETGQQKLHFVGESSGALRAGAFAMLHPDSVDRLVFAAFTYKGEGSPTLTKRAEQVEYYRTHNMRKRDRAMIRSIATRDKPGTSST